MTESVVSNLNLCELEMVLTDIESVYETLVKDGRIIEKAITPDAVREFSVMKRAAIGVRVCMRCGKPNNQREGEPYCHSCYHTWARFFI